MPEAFLVGFSAVVVILIFVDWILVARLFRK